MASLPRPLVRRPTTIGAATLLALGLAVLTPITIPLLYLVDLITGSFQGRRVRTYLLITATLWTELVGVIGATALTVWFLNGRRNPDGWLSANYRLEFWWCKRHVTNLGGFADSQPSGLRRPLRNQTVSAVAPMTPTSSVHRVAVISR